MLTNKIIIDYFKTPYGELILGSYKNQLCMCDWRYRKMRSSIDTRIKKALNTDYEFGSSTIIDKAKKQLTEYFKGNRKNFTIPILMIGTDFQKKVWQALINIPYGKTETYLGLSKSLNNEKVIRAVASANGANAIGFIIPCHRIIGSDGTLVGYAGGLTQKKKLLELEGALNKNQLSLF